MVLVRFMNWEIRYGYHIFFYFLLLEESILRFVIQVEFQCYFFSDVELLSILLVRFLDQKNSFNHWLLTVVS